MDNIQKNQVWQGIVHKDVLLRIVKVQKNKNSILCDNGLSYVLDTFENHYELTDKEYERVYFGIQPTSEVIAFFVDLRFNSYQIMSYEHVGQHGHASIDYARKACKPAKESEYANLKTELESIGYYVKVIKSLPKGL